MEGVTSPDLHADVDVTAPQVDTARLQFSGAQLLGGCVAWDRASGLLAVELQSGGGGSNEASSGVGGSSLAASVAILDPQSPETHFVAHIPAVTPNAAGEGLAALLWSPAACRRLLLAVTTSGAAYSWTMDGSAAGEPNHNDSSSAVAGRAPASCINQWYGRLAFQLPLPELQHEQPPHSNVSVEAIANDSVATAAAAAQQGTQGQRLPPRLLCCRLLESPSAAAVWDIAGAPPTADRPMSAAEAAAHYKEKGLEHAFAAAAADGAAGDELTSAASISAGSPSALPPLHWLRPGLLCFAAVTREGQLLLACFARGMSSSTGGSSESSWLLAPAVQLPLPQLQSLEPQQAGQAQQLLQADVAPASGGKLLVAAVAAPVAAASGSKSDLQHHPKQQLLLFEVSGPPPQLLSASGSGQQQQQPQRVEQLPLSQPAVDLGPSIVRLALLPGCKGGTEHRLLLVTSSSTSSTAVGRVSTTACIVTSSNRGAEGQEVGPSVQLSTTEGQGAAVAVATNGAGCVLLLVGTRKLHCLQASISGSGSSGSGSGSVSSRLTEVLPPMDTSQLLGCTNASLSGQALQETTIRGLALSPNALYVAIAQPGSSALLLLPTVRQARQESEVECCMLELGKRCCASLLAGTSTGSCAWDLCSVAAAACRQWGHPHLQATQALVDAAVEAVRQEARPQYAAAWSRLKCCLLAAAAAAHPAAAADLNAASVRADAAAREWMGACAGIFEHHLPDRAARAAAHAKGQGSLSEELRSAVEKVLPARYWALWAADFSCYLVRSLLYWIKIKQQAARGSTLATKPAATPPAQRGEAGQEAEDAAAAFTAEQNALADSLPCVRLISDSQFYRSFNRVVGSVHKFHRLLSTFSQQAKQSGSLVVLVQKLELVQDMVVLLRTLHEEYSKAQQEGAAAAEAAGFVGGSSSSSIEGAWTFVHAQQSYPVSWSQAATALQALKQQQVGGNDSLLGRVRMHLSNQPEGRGDSAESLLEAAQHLGLLPPRPSAAGGGGRGCGDGATWGGLARVLRMRQVALAAAEAGEAAWGIPLPAPLPAMPAYVLAADLDPPGWLASDAETFGTQASAASGHSNKQPARQQLRRQEDEQARRKRQQHAWECERSAALGLPVSTGNDVSAFEGTMDGMTGRPLSWEHEATYALADGSAATAETLESAGSASHLIWQAAYAMVAPVGAQPWKRLRAQ